jgi:tRNA threonylcarbamoyladenosine biosynthesis protein TsaB
MHSDAVPTHQPPQKVLAIDTSTDRLSVAVGAAGAGAPLAVYEGAGGAHASATLIPTVQRLLAEAGWPMAALDAIAFGCGPGSFTGLRTACAVVQGLAVAARPGGIPVLPVNTLLAVAEEARWQQFASGAPQPDRIVAVLDARMDEMYVADVRRDAQQGLVLHGQPWLSAPEDLPVELASPSDGGGVMLAGNAMAVYGARLPDAWAAVPQLAAWPTAVAILRLAGALWAKGEAVEAADAQPVYVRDKVAQTTEERERIKAAKALAEGLQA